MSLIKTIKDKLAEGASLKDVKHICKRHKEGAALNNFFKYCEELMVQKMIADGKSFPDIIAATGEKSNHFELKWTEARIGKLQTAQKAKPVKEEKKEVPVTAPVAETVQVAPVAEEQLVKRGRKKSKEV